MCVVLHNQSISKLPSCSHQQNVDVLSKIFLPFALFATNMEITINAPLKEALRDTLNPFCWPSESNQDY
jgi:hypothetical protein